MKFTIITRLLIVTCISCWGIRCQAQESAIPSGGATKSLRLEAKQWINPVLKLTQQMQLLTANEEAIKLFTDYPDLLALIKTIHKATSNCPLNQVRIMEIPSNEALISNLVSKEVTKETWEVVKDRFNPKAILSSVNGREGAMHLAACQLLESTRNYIQPKEWTGNLLFVLEYGSEYAIAVTFYQSGESVITGTATFVTMQSMNHFQEVMSTLFGREVFSEKWSGEMLKGL